MVNYTLSWKHHECIVMRWWEERAYNWTSKLAFVLEGLAHSLKIRSRPSIYNCFRWIILYTTRGADFLLFIYKLWKQWPI